MYLQFLFDHLATCLQHAVNGIQSRRVVVALAAFLADFGLYVIHNIELLIEPVNLTHLLFEGFTPTKFKLIIPPKERLKNNLPLSALKTQAKRPGMR